MRWMLVAGWLGVALACEPAAPCDEYVDYLCACHGDDTGVDCEELALTYSSADPEVQDECAVQLDEQREEDEADGATCTL